MFGIEQLKNDPGCVCSFASPSINRVSFPVSYSGTANLHGWVYIIHIHIPSPACVLEIKVSRPLPTHVCFPWSRFFAGLFFPLLNIYDGNKMHICRRRFDMMRIQENGSFFIQAVQERRHFVSLGFYDMLFVANQF